MEYLAEDLGVRYAKLPALHRDLALRHDVVAYPRPPPPPPRPPAGRAAHAHREGGRDRARGGRARRAARGPALVHTYHGHVLRGYFSPQRELAFRAIERGLAHVTDALVAVSDEVRDDLVKLGIAAAVEVRRRPVRVRPRRARRRAATRRARGCAPRPASGPATFARRVGRPDDRDQAAARPRPDDRGDGGRRGARRRRRRRGPRGRRRRSPRGSASPIALPLRRLRRDVAAWYGAFDALLLTSANEGTPVVAIEALAAGRPVVATDVGGTSHRRRRRRDRAARAGRRHGGARGGARPARARRAAAPADGRARCATRPRALLDRADGRRRRAAVRDRPRA